MRSLVCLSGGIDSTTVLAQVVESGKETIPVFFYYGSKHNSWESTAALAVAEHYGLHKSLRLINLTQVMEGFTSNLLVSGGEIPEGHYQEESMKLTVVPARNMIFCSVLAGLAVSEKAAEIWLGVHAGDHHIYPDCRPEFIISMARTMQYGTGERIMLMTPFIFDNKASIVSRGLLLNAPYHLTRTCYKDQNIACGKCGSCRERLEAFAANGVDDPIEYQT